MNNIDFLPQKYRDNDDRRKAGLWRLMVALLFGCAIAATSFVQFGYRERVKSQLQQIQPMLAQAQARETHLVNLRDELASAHTAANLHAIVQAPWPRTQAVAAIIEPLGDSIVLEEIAVSHRQRADATSAGGANEFLPSAKGADTQPKTATERDLETLEAKLFQRRTIVSLVGLTTHQSQLHAYLGRLEASPLLVGVELLTVDSVSRGDDTTRLRFRVEAEIRAPLGRGEHDFEPDATQAQRHTAEVAR